MFILVRICVRTYVCICMYSWLFCSTSRTVACSRELLRMQKTCVSLTWSAMPRSRSICIYILYEYIYMYVYMYIFCYHKFKFRLGWPRINLPDGFAVRCVCFALSGEHRKVVLTEPDADPRPAVWWVGVSYPTLQRTVSDAEVRARRSAVSRHLPCQSLCWFPKVRSR